MVHSLQDREFSELFLEGLWPLTVMLAIAFLVEVFSRRSPDYSNLNLLNPVDNLAC